MLLSQLQQELSQIIEEAQIKLLDIQILVYASFYEFNDKHKTFMQIQSIFMIFTIWECFIKTSFKKFIEMLNLNMSGIPLSKFKDSLIIYHMESVLPQLKEYPKNLKNKSEYFDNFQKQFNQSKIYSYKLMIGKSNIDFNVLNQILEIFCLNKIEPYWKKYQDNKSSGECLDELIKIRHAIAHGTSVENKDYTEDFNMHKNVVLDLMYEIHQRIIECFEKKDYLKEEFRV